MRFTLPNGYSRWTLSFPNFDVVPRALWRICRRDLVPFFLPPGESIFSEKNHESTEPFTPLFFDFFFWAAHQSQRVGIDICRHVCILIQTCHWDTREGAKNYMTDSYTFTLRKFRHGILPLVREGLSPLLLELWEGIFPSACAFASGAGEDSAFVSRCGIMTETAHCPIAFHWWHSLDLLSALAFLPYGLLVTTPLSTISFCALKFRTIIVRARWRLSDVFNLEKLSSSLFRMFFLFIQSQCSLKLNRILHFWLVLTFQDHFRRNFTCGY